MSVMSLVSASVVAIPITPITTRQSQWLDELRSCCLVSLALCASSPGSPKILLTQEAP